MNGTDVIVKVNTGTVGVPVWTAVGKQQGLKISEKVGSIDQSGKEDQKRRVIGGRYEASITLDALYVPDDVAYQALKTAFRAGTLVQLETVEAGTAKETCSAVCTGIDSDFPDQGSATISASFDVDGDWTAAP